jgi:hypothetical protein
MGRWSLQSAVEWFKILIWHRTHLRKSGCRLSKRFLVLEESPKSQLGFIALLTELFLTLYEMKGSIPLGSYVDIFAVAI